MEHIFKIGSDNDRGVFYSWFEAMHTRMDFVFCGIKESEGFNLASLIEEEIHRVELIANRFDPESEITKVNKLAQVAPIEVSDTLCEMISICIEAKEKTEGLFDIAISSKDYDVDLLSYLRLEADRTIVFDKQMTLDLGGYAKGYVLDKIRSILENSGIKNAFVSLGNSSILAMGNHPAGEGWKIALESGSGESITLLDQCYTTSGNFVVSRTHIMNPLSKEYVSGNKTVSVVTDSAGIGEILSTALFVADEKQSEQILKNYDLAPNSCFYSQI